MTQSSFQDTSTVVLRQAAHSADAAEGSLSLRANAQNIQDLAKSLDSQLSASQLRSLTISFRDIQDVTLQQIHPIVAKVATWVAETLKGPEDQRRSACLTDLTRQMASQLKGFNRFLTIDAVAAATPAKTASAEATLSQLNPPVTGITSARDGSSASIQVKEKFHGESETKEALEHLGTGLQRIDARLKWDCQQIAFANILPAILSEKLAPGGLLVIQYEPPPDRAASFKGMPLVTIEDNTATFQFTGNRLINSDIEMGRRLLGKNRDAIGIDLTTLSDLGKTEAMNLVLFSAQLSDTGKLEIYFKSDSRVEAALNGIPAKMRERCTLRPVSE